MEAGEQLGQELDQGTDSKSSESSADEEDNASDFEDEDCAANHLLDPWSEVDLANEAKRAPWCEAQIVLRDKQGSG